jgi:hypothetical protein
MRIFRRSRVKLVLFVLAGFLGGCGGGGGGTSGPGPTPTPTPPAQQAAAFDIPLDMSQKTATSLLAIAGTVPNAAETIVTLGRFAPTLTRFFLDRAAAVDIAGERGGGMKLQLTDRDADGRVSAGDTVTATFVTHRPGGLNQIVSGTIYVDVAGDVQPSGNRLKALVRTDNLYFLGSGNARYSDDPKFLKGSFNVDWQASDVLKTTRVWSSAANDLQEVRGTNAFGKRARWRDFDVTRTVSYNDGLVSIGITLRIDSEEFNGSIVANTSVPLLAHLGVLPHSGALEVTGARNQKLVLTPFIAKATEPSWDSDVFLLDASGAIAGNDTMRSEKWRVFVLHHLWQYDLAPFDESVAVISAQPYNRDYVFTLPQSPQASMGVDEPFVIQFDRDVSAAANVNVRIECGPDRLVSEAVLTRSRARWTVQATRPLPYNLSCGVTSTGDGVNFSVNRRVTDGNGKRMFELPSAGRMTVDNLRPSIQASERVLFDPSSRIRLSGRGSVSEQHPIVSYRWTQVAGSMPATALTFTTPTAAETDVTWGPDVPKEVEPVTVRLTLTDSAGAERSTDLVLLAANLTGASRVLYLKDAPGYPDISGTRWPLLFTDLGGDFKVFNNGESSDGYLAMFDNALHDSGHVNGRWTHWNLTMKAINDAPLAVGTYADTVAPYPYPPAGFPLLALQLDWSDCSPRGSFKVLEIERDAAGKMLRLAVDFETRCLGQFVPMIGSLRINSTIALTR